MVLQNKQNQMWWIQRMFLRLLFLVLVWAKVTEDQNQFMVQAAEVTGSAENVNDPVQPSNHQETNPMSSSFSSRVSTAPLLSSLVVRQQNNISNTTTTNPNHWTMQDNRILILENTTWSAEIVENALILDKTVMVFPGATLIIQGRPLLVSEMTTEQEHGRNNSSSSQEQDTIPMDPFVIVFLDDYDVSISLHPGAHIVLDHVVFWNASHDKTETNERRGDKQSPGLQTLGELRDYKSNNRDDPQPTILARHWQCQFLSRCLDSLGNVEISHSRFHVSGRGRTSYAIAASAGKVHIHRSLFVTPQGASGLVKHRKCGSSRLDVRISQSQFDAVNLGVGVSLGRYNTHNMAVEVSGDVVTIDQSTFVGYNTAIVATARGEGVVVTNCTLMGNKFGFMGYDYDLVDRTRGRVEDCYFWRNGIAQTGFNTARNLYVENVVAYHKTWSAVDLLIYRNLVGFWIAFSEPWKTWDDTTKKTWDDISLDAGRHVTNLTFLDNGVAVLGDRIPIPSRGGNVNFMNSGWYHINYTELATVRLLQDIYWSNDGQTRTVSEQDVREKIRDGFSGGGPGIVQINVTAAPETPFRHSMFWPTSFTNPYTPPTLAEWFQTKQFQPVDPTIVHQTPPLPSTQYLDLPDELAKHNMSDWLGLDETKNGTSNENPQSHNDNNRIVCNPHSDNDHTPEVQEDDPQAVIVKIHTAWSTCAQLSASSEEEWQRWCLAPDSMASTVCPRVCTCGPMIRNHSDSSAVIDEPALDDEPPKDGVYLVHSWWFVGMCCVYFTVLHVVLVIHIRQRWLSPPLQIAKKQDSAATSTPTDHLPLQSSSQRDYTSVPTTESMDSHHMRRVPRLFRHRHQGFVE